MDGSPWFETQDLFDQRRIRLADIDGSGTTDIIYLAHDGVRLYFNQSGNRWSEPQTLSVFPRVDDLDQVQALDLLSNGTACLVWTSAAPGDARHSMRYVDLMGGEKPHLLIGSRNNLGAETRVFYAPSTKFYLADRAAGQRWVTRLPFPVHVLERVETCDWVSRNRFVTRYTYHHGFYDGIEREFRGFGRVDQYDTEELGALSDSGIFPDATNIDATSYVPTVLTKTWFHTGAYFDEARISRQFEHEYWREPDPSAGPNELSDSKLPSELDNGETAEACRSLKGAVLRREVYARDGTDKADRPYTLSEHNYTIKRLQPIGPNRHAVFFTHARETIDFNYERKLYQVDGRNLVDPRVTHNVVLAVDQFGNQLQSAAIGYGRRHDDPDPLLTPADRAKQSKSHVVYTETSYTNPILADDDYRAPLPADARTFELINVTPNGTTVGITNLFGFDELASKAVLAGDGTHDLPYEDINAEGATEAHPYRRPIEQTRTLYRKDDLTAALPLGNVETRALPFESYKLAFTAGLLAVYTRNGQDLLPDRVSVLRDEGRYVLGNDAKAQALFPSSDPDGQYWIPSGRIFFDKNANVSQPAVTAADELAEAENHFFLPRKFADPFKESSTADYEHDLLVVTTMDPVGNIVRAGNDYRVLQPSLITDPNGNRAEVAFDALGMVAGTAVMGKGSEDLGDTLDDFDADLTQGQVDGFYESEDPHVPAPDLLKSATTRIIYDLDRFRRTSQANPNDPALWLPVYAATLARETHASDPLPPQGLKIQIGFGYSDGFGHDVQKKIQAEPGPVIEGGPPVDPRWVGSGWTIFNNKGKPVRQYEPFFSQLAEKRHRFEFGLTAGVSPILFYDPVERIVATLHPNDSWEKIVFDPWRQQSWDVNDTVLIADPKTDPDVGPFFRRLPSDDFTETWYAKRIAGGLGSDEQTAAQKTAMHAATPTLALFDTLGRPFLAIAHNKFVRSGATIDEKYLTRTELDIESNQREVIDANSRIVMRYDYDMLGTRIHQASMEAGERWMLNDVAGKPLYAWDSRNHRFHTTYDPLRRTVNAFLVEGTGPELLIGRTVYGDTADTGLTEPQQQQANLRTKVFKHFDGAGVISTDLYDFKGNSLRGTRQFASDYKNAPDWSQSPALESETFTSSAVYDGLNRAIAVTTPDQSVYRPAFNQANLLEKVDIKLRGAHTATPFVANIDYNAKGQRTHIDYANGASTFYTYDLQTFRLVHLLTGRDPAGFPDDCPQPPPSGWPGCQVQNLSYTYDPAGNISHIRDDAQQTIYFRNKRVEPTADYTYDAVYRLIEATGREHLGQAGRPVVQSYNDAPRVGIRWSANDGNLMGTYVERYVYDAVGNFLQMQHRRSDQAVPGWTRGYAYNETSLIEPPKASNRLSSTTVGNGAPVTEQYTYDLHGNMLRMPQLQIMQWDFRDQLQMTQRQRVSPDDEDGIRHQSERTYYVYDGNGQRVRKVTERPAAAGQTPTRIKERIYLGGYEVYREYDADGSTVSLERESLHVMDDKQRIAMVEKRTQGDDGSLPQLIRYQFGNHLGSAILELDAQAQIISYEEYYPYGSTSYQAVRRQTDTPKQYRYTGMERDEESGLNYHRARYYAPWLGRWTCADPAGLDDGANLYVFARNNPLRFTDPNGTDTESEAIRDIALVAPAAPAAAPVVVETAPIWVPLALVAVTVGLTILYARAPRVGGSTPRTDFPPGEGCGSYCTVQPERPPELKAKPDPKVRTDPKSKPEPKVGPEAPPKPKPDDDERKKGELHHIAGHQNEYSPKFKKIFANATLPREKTWSLEDPLNLVVVPGHQGPHGPKYSKIVYRRLTSAVAGLSPHTPEYQLHFVAEMIKLREDVNVPTNELFGLVRTSNFPEGSEWYKKSPQEQDKELESIGNPSKYGISNVDLFDIIHE
jgi:RHS repeat-associated protein